MKKLLIGLLLLSILIVTGCDDFTKGSFNINSIITPAVDPADLSIAAPLSLKPALDELSYIFEDENSQLTADFYYGSPSELINQIEGGKTTDFVIVSSQKQINELQAKGLIVADTRKILVQNSLVLVTNVDNDDYTSLDDLTTKSVHDISIGKPSEVASGVYAEVALKNMGLYDEVEDKIEYADSTTEMIEDLEEKNDDVAIMYRSDVVGNDNLRIIQDIPGTYYNPILYPMAQTKSSAYPKQDEVLEKFLESEQAQTLLESYGFTRFVVSTDNQTSGQSADSSTDSSNSTQSE